MVALTLKKNNQFLFQVIILHMLFEIINAVSKYNFLNDI